MERELKEMQKILEEINSDLDSLSRQTEKPRKPREYRQKDLESVIRVECAEIKKMISAIDNQAIADSVSRMVVNQLLSPLQDAIATAVKEPGKAHTIGKIAEDMKRKMEMLSDRHIRVIKCLSKANGDWVNYNSLSNICGISQSCLRGYMSDLKRVYEIPIERSQREGKTFVRIDPQTIKKLALGYQAARINPS
jgi:hypothetical protein